MLGETFIRQLGWIILAAAVFAWIARRLRLPTIVAYLLAGLVIGPATGQVELTASLELISEIGIVLLLFLVGLELSLDKLRGMGRAVLIAGLAQLGLTAVLGWMITHLAGFSGKSALLLAGAWTFSSTVVAVKLLEEKGSFNTLPGRLSVGILLMQDLAVIVVLTLMGGLQAQASPGWSSLVWNLVRAFGGLILLLGLAIGVSRYLLPKPFTWTARWADTSLIGSLCWCFVVVAMAHALGLSVESGAFMAGVGLAQLPFTDELRRRVHPLMNFFIAVFFVSLGIKMQLGAALGHWPVALGFVAFVLLGKLGLVAGTLRWLGFSGRTAWHTGITLAQVSEFSFILVAVGAQAGWLGAEELSMVGLVGLCTLCLSACGILYSDPLYDGLKRWLPEGETAETEAALAEQEQAPEASPTQAATLQGHVIVVGMNTLGRLLARRLHDLGERVLAIDTDPGKLAGLPCLTMHGNVEYPSVLEEAGLAHAKLLVSALRIEPTNDLLAYRCRQAGVPCSIVVVDLSVVDNLLEMDVRYLMIPKVDGIKLQTRELQIRGFLKP